jgi:hypothetical protein
LDRIKSQNRKIYGQIQNFLRELESRSNLGVPLHGEWEGCRRAHVSVTRAAAPTTIIAITAGRPEG